MARTTISDEDRKFVETWENIGEGVTGILRLDPMGQVRHEMISGARNFILTTEERMITQDAITVDGLDPFRNGTFRPVIVPDSVTVESNPNALSEEEIVRILNSSDVAWSEWLTNIDSVATIKRMLEIAENVDTLPLKRYRALEERLVEVRPLNRLATNDPKLQEFLEARPSSDDRREARRRMGGMSSDYRV